MDVRLPDGTIIKNVPDGITQADLMARVGNMKPRTALSAEDISSHAKKAAISNWRGENPFKAGLVDFSAGATGLMRGGANMISDGLGDKIWPTDMSADTGYKTAGTVTDPAAWAVAGGVGHVLPYVPVMGRGVVEGGKAVLKNLTSGGIAGGAISGISGEADPSAIETGIGVGAAANTVLPPAIRGVTKGLSAAKQYVFPSPGRIAVKAAGDKADDVINALMQSRSAVPDVNPTVGQASVPANSAEFAALQKLVEGKDPSRYIGDAGIKGQQESARRAAIQTIGKTPQELADAIKARSVASAANYQDAYDEVIKRDPELRKLWKNPYFKDEVGEAWKIARARGLSPSKNLTEFLHFVKEGLDARIQSANRPDAPAISRAAQSTIQDVKAQLVDWLGSRNPSYDTARLEHIAMSKPINQMKVGQELELALTAPISEAERPAVFGSAVRKTENTVSKATGKPRIEDLTPSQKNVIDAIESSLKNNADYKALAAAGSKNLENRIGAPHAPPTGWFQPMVSAARSWVNTALGTGHERALEKLAPMMANNPQEFARIMQAATPQQRAVIQSLMEKYATRAAIVGGANYTGGH